MLKRSSLITLLVVAIAIGGIYLLFLLTPSPPAERLEEARKALAEARKQGAEKYAPDLYASSEKALNHALALLNAEHKRFILFRSYEAVDSTCGEAIKLAGLALNKSLANSRELEVSLKARITDLDRLVEQYDPWMNSLPLSASVRRKFLNGKMWLSEAVIDFDASKLQEGDEKARKAARSVEDAVDAMQQYLEDYFVSQPAWMNWYRESVEQSRSARTSLIVIDKMARTCRVYRNGKLKKTYEIEMGSNWVGDKRFRGDKSTPEGRYRVVKKLENGNTRYYKALLIDYPNQDDRARFEKDKRNGAIPHNADIGGLIEIHGHGGKGADWTDGCVALSDEDMHDLFSQVAISTPVTIVGSLVPLDHLLKN